MSSSGTDLGSFFGNFFNVPNNPWKCDSTFSSPFSYSSNLCKIQASFLRSHNPECYSNKEWSSGDPEKDLGVLLVELASPSSPVKKTIRTRGTALRLVVTMSVSQIRGPGKAQLTGNVSGV